MKLSDYKDEAAIELVADLMVPIVDIIGDETVASAFRSGKPKITIAQTILKAHSKEIMDLFTIINGEEYHCTPISLMADLLEILNDPLLEELFTSAQTE